MSRLRKWRKEVNRLQSEKMLADRTLAREKKKLKQTRVQARACLSAQKILQEIAQTVQRNAHNKIAAVVSRCLSSIFSDPYEFCIDFAQKRGKTEARMYFKRNGKELDPLSATGGGVVDVAAFALRVAALLLTLPAQRKLVILDEPFKFLSEQYRPAVREMLELLAEEFQIQFVIITHIQELETGKIVQL